MFDTIPSAELLEFLTGEGSTVITDEELQETVSNEVFRIFLMVMRKVV